MQIKEKLEFRGVCAELEIKNYDSSNNFGHNIVDKLTKLSKSGFLMECYTADSVSFQKTRKLC